MRKSKVLKALLVFGMSIATATSVVGMTACNGGHEHTYGDWQKDKDGHWKVATCHTDVTTEKEAHKDENKDNKCDVCGYTLQEASKPGEGEGEGNKPGEGEGEGNKPGEGEGEQNPPVAKDDLTINIVDAPAVLSNGTSLGDGVSIFVAEGKTAPSIASSGGKKPLVAGNEITNASHRMTLTSKANSAIKLDLEADATVIVYANSANGDDRTLGLYSDLTGTATKEIKVNATGNDLDAAFFDVKGGETCYIAASNNLYVFYIIVTYKEVNETATLVGAPTCTEAGNSVEHYKTSYGRYYTLSGETKTYLSIGEIKKTAQNAKGHSYAVKADSLTIPTNDIATNQGKVTLACNDCTHEEVVNLPILSSPDYGTPVAGENGQSTYSIEKNGVTITFTAETVTQTKYKFNTLYENLFTGETETELGIRLDNANTLAEGIKACGWTNQATEATAWDSNYKVSYSGNKLTVSDNSSKAANAYILFENAKTSGVYKVSGTVFLFSATTSKPNNAVASKWSFVQLISGSTFADADTFASMRTDSNKKIGITAGIGGDTVSGTPWAYTAADEFSFELIVNLDDKNVSLVLKDKNGSEVYNEKEVAITAEQWAGIRIQTGDSALRRVELSNFSIQERVVDDGTTTD